MLRRDHLDGVYIISCSFSGQGKTFAQGVSTDSHMALVRWHLQQFWPQTGFMCENNWTYICSNSAQTVCAGWPEKPLQPLRCGRLSSVERCEYDNFSTQNILFDAFLKPLASHHRIGSHVTFEALGGLKKVGSGTHQYSMRFVKSLGTEA